jgi:hypothetical protein
MWIVLSERNSRLQLTHFFADWAAVTHSDILPTAGRAGTKTILNLEGQPLLSLHFIVTLQDMHLVHVRVSARTNATLRPFKIRLIRRVETSGTSYPVTQHHLPEERRFRLHNDENHETFWNVWCV